MIYNDIYIYMHIYIYTFTRLFDDNDDTHDVVNLSLVRINSRFSSVHKRSSNSAIVWRNYKKTLQEISNQTHPNSIAASSAG